MKIYVILNEYDKELAEKIISKARSLGYVKTTERDTAKGGVRLIFNKDSFKDKSVDFDKLFNQFGTLDVRLDGDIYIHSI